MSLIDKVQKAFLTLFNTEFKGKFIVDYSSLPERKDLYGTVGVSSLFQKHKTQRHFNSSEDKFREDLVETFEGIITVQTYGDHDYSLIENARSLLRFTDSKLDLYKQDISVINVGSIQRVPEKRDTVYVPRASFDLHFYVSVVYSKESDWIEEVGIHENVYNEGSKVLDEELRVKRSGK